MYGYRNNSLLVNNNFISIDDFYSDFINNTNISDDVVYFLDEFIQSDIIKILEYKS